MEVQSPSRIAAPLQWAVRASILLFAAAGLGWTVYLSNFLVFKNSGSPIERHTYASSHTDFHAAMRSVVKEAFEKHQGYKTRIEFDGRSEWSAAWPLYWSLRRFTNYATFVVPNTKAQFIIIDEHVMDGPPDYKPNPSWSPPPYKDRYDWERFRFRYYWQPHPLNWKAMLLIPEKDVDSEWRQRAETFKNEWGKLWTSMLLRDEDLQGNYRWESLDGIDVYIGRLKS